MNLAVVGAGISGLATAYVLGRRHAVTVFEAECDAGGHANTATVIEGSRRLNIDTGFIVYNETNYPMFCRLLADLHVNGQPSDMSFSVVCEKTGLEYCGTSLNTLFAQRLNLLSPKFWRMLIDILRFNASRPSPDDLSRADLTVAQYVSSKGYSRAFVENYLVPLGSSLWSCSSHQFRSFPISFVVEFLENHGMLRVMGRPQWLTVNGGSQAYVREMSSRLGGDLVNGTPVRKLYRRPKGVDVELTNGHTHRFDEVILATHADTSLDLVADPDDLEAETLACFPYQDNHICLHTDTRVLPARKPAWASWNYRIPPDHSGNVSISYNMNRLQSLDAEKTYCVSLNQFTHIAPEHVIRQIKYRHPVFSFVRNDAQSYHQQMLRRNRLSYCGAYWGHGFHEDGIRSGLAVATAFDIDPQF